MSPGGSIRARLARVTTVSVTAVALLCAVSGHQLLRTGLRAEIRGFALHEAEELANAVAPLETPAQVRGRPDLLGPASVVRGVVAFQVWTPDGELVATFPPKAAAPWPEGLAAAASGGMPFEEVDLPGEPPSLRVALPASGAGGTRWIVIAAVSRAPAERALSTFRRVSALAVPLVALLAYLGSRALVGRAFRPVQALVRDARVIAAEGPSRRLAPPPQGSELAELAQLVNEMLDRTEGLVARLRTFTSQAGHELRTPLARMRGEAEAALTSGDPRRGSEALASVLEEVDELRKLIDALLELARGGESDLVDEPLFPLEELVAEVVEDAVGLAREQRIDLALAATVAAPVHGSRLLLGRTLWNVLDNALKFTPAGGRIRVSMELAGGSVLVDVEDSGPGLLVDRPELLFEPFARGPAAEGRAGLGLGLALGRAIARRHGGELAAVPSEGGGARLRLSLPLSREAGPRRTREALARAG